MLAPPPPAFYAAASDCGPSSTSIDPEYDAGDTLIIPVVFHVIRKTDGTGAQILHDLGVRSVRLLTNNPAKVEGLEAHGMTVLRREPLTIHPRPENVRYLRTKRDRMGHLLQGLDEVGTTGIAGGRA